VAAKFNYEKLRVLIIDDDPFTRCLIAQMLREIGVRSVTNQANGKDGLMELVRTRPHIVLCDIHMEPMNGLQFLKGVRNIKVKGVDLTPVVFLTADANADTVAFAKAHGVAGYLVKPTSRKLLNERIDTVIAADPALSAALSW
jgi:two-component system chemotaxis response regulator CheY